MPSCAPNRQTKNHRCVFLLFFYLALAHAGQRVQESIATLPHTPLSLRVKRSNPVIYARAYARLYYDWIATVTAFPCDESEYVKTSGSAV